MASEKGPTDADLDTLELPHNTQLAKKAETVDATDVILVDIEYGSFSSSSEDPMKDFVIQALVTEDERVGVYDKNINNKYDINSEGASDDMEAKLPGATESDAGRENRVLQKLLRAPRYFDSPLSNWLACNEVSEDDDQRKKNTAKKGQKICYICGDINHSGNRCKKVHTCFICSGRRHLGKDCPNKFVELDCASTPCLKCGNTGHDMFSCTGAYDSEDLKAIECYICKKAGHLCCVEKKGEGPTVASCYRCGEYGHFAPECTKSNVITFDVQLFCNKCKERGHSKKKCPKTKAKHVKKYGGATTAEKHNARRSRNRNRSRKRKQTQTCNALSNQQQEGSSALVYNQCQNSRNKTQEIQALNPGSSPCSTFQVKTE